MKERKWLILAIGIIVGVVVGADLGYAFSLPQITKVRDENSKLMLQFDSLNATYGTLNATYTWLKQHSFTYYVVQDSINVSNIQIFQKFSLWYYLNGTITNIGSKPLEAVYVYVIFVNPDGTKDFSPYRYEKIEDLYMGETAAFEISLESYNEGQTAELFLVY